MDPDKRDSREKREERRVEERGRGWLSRHEHTTNEMMD